MKKCEHPSPNHSKDILTIYYGRTKPMVLCGYHNEKETLEKMEQALNLLNPERITK